MRIKAILKPFIPYLLGIICGYIITLQVFSELIPVFLGGSDLLYKFTIYLTLIASMIFFTLIFQLVFIKKLNHTLFILIYISYFTFLFIVLFTKIPVGRVLILNPITGIFDTFTNMEMLVQTAFNLVIFIPAGYFFKAYSKTKTVLLAICISAAIELIQYIFMVGFCDTFDIILYTIGIFLGRAIFKRYTLEFANQKH